MANTDSSNIIENMVVGGLTNAAISYTTKLAIVGTGAISLPIIIKAALIGATFTLIQRAFMEAFKVDKDHATMIMLLGGVLLPLIACNCMQDLMFAGIIPVDLPVLGHIDLVVAIKPFVEADNMHYMAAGILTATNYLFNILEENSKSKPHFQEATNNFPG